MTDRTKMKLCNIVVVLAMIPTFLLFQEFTKNLSDSMSIYFLFFLIIKIIIIYAVMVIISIALMNILMSIISVIICKLNGEKIIDVYFFPFHYCLRNRTLEAKNIMFFSSNYVNYEMKDILTINDYQELKKDILKRNRMMIIFLAFFLVLLFIVSLYFQWIYGYILCLVLIIQTLTQSKFEKVSEPRGVSLRINDNYLLQFISAQLCVQEFQISPDIFMFIKNNITTIDEYRFLKEMIVSIIINPHIIDVSNDFDVDSWIDYEIYSMITNDLTQIYIFQNDLSHLISQEEISFYEHYDILLLYIIRNKGKYIDTVKNYIEKRLNLIKDERVNDNYLSEKILTKQYNRFEDAYYDALKGQYIFEHDFTKVKTDHIFRRNLENQFLQKS